MRRKRLWRKTLTWMLASAMLFQNSMVFAAEETETLPTEQTEAAASEQTEAPEQTNAVSVEAGEDEQDYSGETVDGEGLQSLEELTEDSVDPADTGDLSEEELTDITAPVQPSQDEETESEAQPEPEEETPADNQEAVETEARENAVQFSSEEGAVVISSGQDVTNGIGTAENGTIVFSVVPDENYTVSSVLVDGITEARATGNENEYIIEGILTDNTVVSVDTEAVVEGTAEEAEESVAAASVDAASERMITGTADHIDLGIASLASLSVGDKTLYQTVYITREDVAAATITAVQNGSAVAFSADYSGLSISAGTGGVIQIHIPGCFPVGTKQNPVQYTVSISRDVTFCDSETGATYVRTMTFSASFHYWDWNNGCPILLANVAGWQAGCFVPCSGMDFILGCASDALGYLTIQKNVVSSDGSALNLGGTYTFQIYTADGAYVKDLSVPVDADGYGISGTVVDFGTYYIVESTPSDTGDYVYTGTTIVSNGVSGTGTTSGTVTVGFGASNASFCVTNTYRTNATGFTVQKLWDDDDNRDGIRPASVQVQLKADEKVWGDAVELNEANGWSYTWSGLPEVKNGNAVTYTAEEINVVDGYEPVYSDGTGTITNKHVSASVEVKGAKSWDDSENAAGKRPESITVRLLADGVEKASKEVTAEDGWSWDFGAQPKYEAGKEVVYTVSEDAVAGYKSVIEGLNITNVLIAETEPDPEPDTGKVTVTKQTLNALGEAIVLDGATFHIGLFSDEAMTASVAVKTVTFDGTASKATVTFDGLKAGTYYVAEVDSTGRLVTVGEFNGGAYVAKYPENGGTENHKVEVSNNETAEYSFNNVFPVLPTEYEYSKKVTVTKNVKDVKGNAVNSDETFYAGIFDNKECTHLATQAANPVVPLKMSGNSAVSAEFELVIKENEAPLKLYVTEVTSTGELAEKNADFGYTVEVSNGALVLDIDTENAAVVITNTVKETQPETPVQPETPTEAPDETEKPDETESEKPGETESEVPGETESEESGETESEEPGETESEEPFETESEEPFETESEEPFETESEEPTETESEEISEDPTEIDETEDKKGADPAGTEKDNQKGDSVNTGDETPIILYVGLLAVSVLVILLVLIGIYRRRRA